MMQDFVIIKGEKVMMTGGSLFLLGYNIKSILEIKGLENLGNLRELNLDSNQIKEIAGLEKLTSLRKLSLRNNQIEEIKGLDSLTDLSELNLSNNSIREIKGLDNLHKLKTLWLKSNEITEIKGLENLSQLTLVVLEDNPIKEEEQKYVGYGGGAAQHAIKLSRAKVKGEKYKHEKMFPPLSSMTEDEINNRIDKLWVSMEDKNKTPTVYVAQIKLLRIIVLQNELQIRKT